MFSKRFSEPPFIDDTHLLTNASHILHQIVMTALALERFQLAHQFYPPNLQTLIPEFLAESPTDLDGHPLRYRTTDIGRYLIYSVGLDGKDDGATQSSDQEANTLSSHVTLIDNLPNWVWGYPKPAP
jgi:hypothetical protein